MNADALPCVMVIEDEAAICELLALNLTHAGFAVQTYLSAEAADKEIAKELPDLLIIDWMLPGQSGIAFAKKLKKNERTAHVPLIMLTARVDEHDRVEGLEAGFDDYVLKPFSPKELVARVRALLRRVSPHLSDETLVLGAFRLNPASHRLTISEKDIALGPTEFRLLHFLMTHPHRVFSREHLLNEVWGDHVFIEDRSVDVAVRRLRRALTPVGEEARIKTVHGVGYRFAK